MQLVVYAVRVWTRIRGFSALPQVQRLRSENPILLVTWLLTTLLALNSIGQVAAVVRGRLTYPFDLEWMEGALVDNTVRLAQGQPIYTEPSFEFATFIYNPLFYALAVIPTWLVGPGPTALRLVSVLAMAALVVGLVALVRRSTGSLFAGVVSAGCFFATYELSGGWMDIARVDATVLALEVVAVLVAHGSGLRAPIIAGLLTAMAYFTKQPAALVAVPIGLMFLLEQRYVHTFVFSGTVLGGIGLSVGLLQWMTDGWYWFWTVDLPSRHFARDYEVVPTFEREILRPLPLLLVVAVGGVLVLISQVIAPRLPAESQVRSPRWPRIAATGRPVALLVFAGLLPAQAWMSYNHAGSFMNCIMPAHLALAVLAGMALGHASRLPVAGQVTGLVAVAIQLHHLSLRPETWIPSAEDLAAGEQFVAQLDAVPGKKLIAYRGFFYRPGLNPPHATQMAAGDLFQPVEDPQRLEQKVRSEAAARFARHEYRQVWLDEEDFVFTRELERYYVRVRQQPRGRLPFTTRTGSPMRPRILYEPRPD